MNINIIGNDWDTCYLQKKSVEKRKKQVIRDLEKYVNEHTISKDDLITIDLEDHSTGFEQFIVAAVFPKSKLVKLVYLGGGS